MRAGILRTATLVATLAACDPSPPLPALATPHPAGSYSPSHIALAPDAPPTGAILADIADCEPCHADIADQWRASAHGFASFQNPIYRVAVDRFRAQAGPDKARFCAGCHDIALLVDGILDRPPAADSRARVGISCRICHGIEHTRPDGNGSYTLTARPIVIPRDGDPDSVAQHKATTALAPLRTAALCGTCHRSFLGQPTGTPHFLAGADDLTPWSRSEYAASKLARIDDDIAEKDCRACHMRKEPASDDAAAKDGKVASHRFPGGHTWMASMRGDPRQLERERAQIRGALSIDAPALIHPARGLRTLPADGAHIEPGEPLLIDIVVRNLRVGHRFPGGVSDAQDTWIEITIDDARGHRIAEAGTQHEHTGADPTAHVLRALILDEAGAPLFAREVHRFRALAANHTIPPRDAAVISFAFDAPSSLEGALPLKVTARLRHRSRSLDLQRAACTDSETPWGRAYAAIDPHDACAPQQITDIARAETLLGPGAPSLSREPTWKRLYDHALGLQHAVQERLHEARPSLERALLDVEATGTARDRAIVHWALAWLEAHEGRTDEALRRLDHVETLIPGHPATAALRGDALSIVWRWSEAVSPLAAAARAAPRDDAAWTRLALALGSRGGDPRASLHAALTGLAIQPRDPDLLHVQALALRALHDPGAPAAAAAYDEHRPADVIPEIKSRCSMNTPGCALERNPVHTHRMRQP